MRGHLALIENWQERLATGKRQDVYILGGYMATAVFVTGTPHLSQHSQNETIR